MTGAIMGVIPARGGSKRLPGKNLLKLGGDPLIAWTIRAALESATLETVVVSTDDEAIAEVAIRYGAEVPWLRPAELATDSASSIDVILHALAAYERAGARHDAAMMLQPTSPFRRAETIKQAVESFEYLGRSPVVSVCPAQAHPDWCFRIDPEGKIRPYVAAGQIPGRSQDLPPAYQLNGALYVATRDDLYRDRSFLGPKTYAFVMENREESLDIDDAWDWHFAEYLVTRIEPLDKSKRAP